MQYEVIFDFLSDLSNPWSFCFVFAFMITIGFVKCWRSKNNEERQFIIHWLCGVILLGGFGTWSTMHVDSAMRNAFQAGRFSTVSGNVANLRTGFKLECFDVQHVQFCCSDFVHTGGFDQTVNRGCPIREGLGVRISYMPTTPAGEHNVIFRFEVQKPVAK